MADIKDQLIKDSYNYVLQSDLSTGVVYRIGGSIPINPIFSSGLTVNDSLNYTNGTEQPGYVLTTDGSGYSYWGPITGSSSFNNYYGSFSDTTTQVVNGVNTPTAWSANTTELSNGISIVDGSKITVSNDGIFEIGYSAQIEKTTGSGADVTIWAKINGVDVDRSSSTISLENNSVYALPFVSYIFDLYSGDYVEFYFSSSNEHVQITTLSGLTSPTRPVSPSLIIVGKAIGNAVLSNSGDSFVTGFTLSNDNLTLSQNRVGQYSDFTVNLPYLNTSGGTIFGDLNVTNSMSASTYYGYGGYLTGISRGGGGGAGGQLYYFNISNTQTPYYEFSTTATTSPEQTISVTTGSSQTSYIGGFMTPSILPNITNFPAGIISFYLHAYTSESNATFEIYCELYKRTTGGVETILTTTDPTPVIGTSTLMYITDSYFSGATLNDTDRLVVKIFATNTSNQTKTINFVSEGSQHYSFSLTTIPTFTDTYVTGFTYSNNTFTLKQNENQPDLSQTINSVTGWTVNGNLTVTGNTSVKSLTATTTSASTVNILSQNAPLSPVVSTPFIDDYNRVSLSPGGTPSVTYTNTNTGAGNTTIVSNYLNIVNGISAGVSYTTIPLSSFSSPFNPTLSSNTSDIIEWTFNLRTSRNAIFTGFGAGQYGGAVVLVGSNANVQTLGQGYALIYGNTGTRNWKLVNYNNGLQGTLTDIVSGGIFAAGQDYVSVKITYTPSASTWSYYFRDDGLVAWGDPTTTNTLIGTAVDSTYTSTLMSVFGVYFNYSTANNQNLQFDNLRIQETTTPATTPIDILTIKNYSSSNVFNVKDNGTTTISGSVTSSGGFIGSFSGTHLGNGSSLILGQSGIMVSGTSALNLTNATTTFTLIPGLSTTITAGTQTMVYIQTNGGVNTLATTSTGGSALDVTLAVDGAIPAAGGYQRIYADNPTGNATVTNWVSNWNTTVLLVLPAGTHTIGVYAVYVAGSNATVSGGAGTIKQGTLTVMVLKNI